MNLTRHNYEEYFLRYVDGELAADERREVEAFLEEHPDLFEEMDSLRMTVLPQDEVFAFDKSLLYQYTTEERPARIIPLTRRRLSVAAAVAIALGTSAALWIARDRGFLHTDGPSIALVRPRGQAANGSSAGSATSSANGASTGAPAEGTAPVSPDATTGGSAPAGATPNGSTPNGSTPNGSTPDGAATTATTASATTAITAGSTTAGSTTATTATGATTGSATGATTATHDPAATAIATTTGTTATTGGATGTTNSAITAATTASATSTTTGAANAVTAALQTASSGDPTTHALASKENNPTRPVTTATPVSYHTLEDGDQAADEDKILFVRADQVVNGEVKGFFRRAGRLLKRSTSINNDIVRADSDR